MKTIRAHGGKTAFFPRAAGCPAFFGRARRGQMAITMVIATLLLLMIIIPMLDHYVKNEAKWSVKERKSTLAFHLAEAGLDRAYWKLKENSTNWTTIATGGVVDGYHDDVVYSDIEGGSYKVKMEQGDTGLEIKITATGKDFSNNEYRAIKAVYTKEGVTAALQAGSVGAGGNANVHWGPMMSVSSMELKGGSNELYPRKYARGSIIKGGGGGAGNYGTRDNDPNQPNKGPHTSGDHIEWWSYNEPPGVPDVLTPDTSYYMELAKAQTCTPAGTIGCYYEGNRTGGAAIGGLVDTTCTVGADPKVRFFTNNAEFGSTKYFCGVLIVLGNLTFKAGGKSPEGDLTVDPPATAWKEYQCNVPTHNGDTDAGDMTTWTYTPDGTHPGTCDGPHGDTAEPDEYPGDAGYRIVSPYNFKTGRVATGELGYGGTGKELSYKGYIYTGGTFDNAGGGRIFGSVQVAGAGGMSGGGDIFYDSGLNIRFLNNNITRSSWHEVAAVPF
ncbi:MAG: hypothetical protein A2X35_03740 [Elusimicrobia bacterium GWA2_61_42]|nr:MAG: hypothetical protein A2X35_03740 [Elusimicrobia bacterium GWA2_61_42]OGR77692.1 MAG: hypothetical protein A2X38_09980 [Elusimicrobia bacterium GWC2_61_25]